jgi:hypothetical protein
MTTLAPWTEQGQPFVTEVREQCEGDLAQHTRQSWQDFLSRLSERGIGISAYESMSGVPAGVMPGTASMRATS